MKILIVEDNRHLAQNVETYLQEEGNVCAIAFTYHEAVEKVVSLGYDIVIWHQGRLPPQKPGSHAEIRCQELTLHPEARTLTVHDRPVELTQKEYELLLFLLTN